MANDSNGLWCIQPELTRTYAPADSAQIERMGELTANDQTLCSTKPEKKNDLSFSLSIWMATSSDKE